MTDDPTRSEARRGPTRRLRRRRPSPRADRALPRLCPPRPRVGSLDAAQSRRVTAGAQKGRPCQAADARRRARDRRRRRRPREARRSAEEVRLGAGDPRGSEALTVSDIRRAALRPPKMRRPEATDGTQRKV